MRDAHTRRLGLRSGLPAFLLGFLAASFEIYLLREFAAEFMGNELIFGLLLGSWLLWGGLGSFVRPGRRAGAGPSRLAGLYGGTIALFCASLALLRFSHKLMGLLPAETTGLVPALGFALLLSSFLSFPLGHAFVLNAGLLGDDVPLVYILESAGAAAAGFAVHFLLIPRLSNWDGAACIGAGAAALAFFALEAGRWKPLIAAALFLSAGLAVADHETLRIAWRPLDLIDAEDTPYGKLLIVRNKEQVTLFNNGLPVFTQPDGGASEEGVHFALLQRDSIRRVLLIGGTASGGVGEVLKYPEVRVDCVELDPAVLRLAEKHLPPPALADLADPRVRVITRDGRTFLEGASERYDAILLDLPEPATAQVNRYYTKEFFHLARRKLEPGGILSFVVPGAENYISGPLGAFLASLAATLRTVFPEVAVVPGATSVFLGSDAPLSIDPDRLADKLCRLGLETRFVSPGMLPSRLDPGRVGQLEAKLASPGAKINRDLVPVSYYFQSLLWAGQFRGVESRLLEAAGKVPPFWILDAPLAVIAGLLLVMAAGRKPPASRFLVPVAVMGFTSIVVELAMFIAFQANFGYVYGKIPLLLASFMAGLVVGSSAGRRRREPGRGDLAVAQAGFVVLLLVTYGSLSGWGGERFPFVLLAALGSLCGYLFVAANRLFLGETTHPGAGYGVDLIASFVGVVLASALLIPLFGIPALVLRVTVLNAICLAFVLVARSR